MQNLTVLSSEKSVPQIWLKQYPQQLTQLWIKWRSGDSALTRPISLIFMADSTLTRLIWVRVESNWLTIHRQAQPWCKLMWTRRVCSSVDAFPSLHDLVMDDILSRRLYFMQFITHFNTSSFSSRTGRLQMEEVSGRRSRTASWVRAVIMGFAEYKKIWKWVPRYLLSRYERNHSFIHTHFWLIPRISG